MTSVDILAGLTLLGYIAIVALLVRQYFRTRDIGDLARRRRCGLAFHV